MMNNPQATKQEWTLEIVPGHADRINRLSGLVDEIFITMIPGTPAREVLGAIEQVAASGFRPVPHMAARSFASEAELAGFCDGLRELGVEKALVIAGGLGEPAGPFKGSIDILRSEAFQRSGVSTVALAGHPEGNPVDPEAEHSLRSKLEWIREQGIHAEIVTQWTFNPEGMRSFVDRIKREAPEVPVRVGIAGPASLKTLLKYAKICGVTAAKEVLRKQGLSLGRLLVANDPAKFVSQVPNATRFHLYPFGGLDKCANWLEEHTSAAQPLSRSA